MEDLEKTLVIAGNLLLTGFLFGWIYTPFILLGGIYLWKIDCLTE